MTDLIQAYTLVDITDTGTTKVRDSNTKEYHQQQNLNVLLQTIGLRTQPLEPKIKVLKNVSSKDYGFHDFYNSDDLTVWVLEFYIEPESIWDDGNDYFAILNDDANGIAITPDLDNTVDFLVDIFDTSHHKNLYFELHC